MTPEVVVVEVSSKAFENIVEHCSVRPEPMESFFASRTKLDCPLIGKVIRTPDHIQTTAVNRFPLLASFHCIICLAHKKMSSVLMSKLSMSWV